MDYTGAVTAQDHLNRLDIAPLAALGTSFIPFVDSATELILTGGTPGPGSTAADAAAVTPTYAGPAGTGAAIGAIDAAIDQVSSLRAYLGAVENRFSHVVERSFVAAGSATAAESRIRDTDVAAEMTALTRSQVLSQVGTAMLAQANQSPRLVLDLLA